MHALRNSLPRCGSRTLHLATISRTSTTSTSYARLLSTADGTPGPSTSVVKDTSTDASSSSQEKNSKNKPLSEKLRDITGLDSSPYAPRQSNSSFKVVRLKTGSTVGEGASNPSDSSSTTKRRLSRKEKLRYREAKAKVVGKKKAPGGKLAKGSKSKAQAAEGNNDFTFKAAQLARRGDGPPARLDSLEGSAFGQDAFKDEAAVFNDNLAEDRSIPPHILKQDVIKTGVMMPSETTLTDVPPIEEQRPVDTLSHNLDRVLFNPGVHWLQDPRSRVYNFTPWLQRIPKVNDFAFDRLSGFVKSSRDEELRTLAKREGKQFAGSTSSLSGMLCQIYFLLSEYRDIDYSTLSQHFKNQPATFTSGQRTPATVLLNYKDGVYAIDSQSAEYDDPDKNVLTWLGTLLENFLTKNPTEFKNFMNFGEALPESRGKRPKDAFRYSKSNNFIMRSQLDCQDKRLPGTGVFDIKTRACVSVRMDILNYEENAGYMIWNQAGVFESFEREYYDLIRSGFLKYSFQVRIGNMDGVMVTYHNTERIFGFQYISLDEMDQRLFGPTPGVGNKVFNYCVSLLEEIMQEVSQCFPKQSVVCAFETRMPGRVLEVYVQPAEWDGKPEDKPMKKLVVSLDHQAGGLPARPATAMREPDHWSISYQIGEPSLSLEDIKRDYSGLELRKRRTLALPSHVTNMAEGEKFWENLKFSSAQKESQAADGSEITQPSVAFQPDSFTLSTAHVENYREMSRKGRQILRRIEAKETGMPKTVLGLDGAYEEDQEWAEFWREKKSGVSSNDIAKTERDISEDQSQDVWSSSNLKASIGAEVKPPSSAEEH